MNKLETKLEDINYKYYSIFQDKYLFPDQIEKKLKSIFGSHKDGYVKFSILYPQNTSWLEIILNPNTKMIFLLKTYENDQWKKEWSVMASSYKNAIRLVNQI